MIARKYRPDMKIIRADEKKAESLVLVKQNGSSEEIASNLMDFHWQIAQIVERREKQKLLEQMREQMQGMTISEKQMFLLGMILNEETIERIWQKTFDDPTSEFED